MVDASLTDARWFERVPSDRPAIVVADGLMPFLAESDLKQLFCRLTDHFPSGQLAFNNYSKLASRLMKVHPSMKAIGIGEAANPGFDDLHEPEKWHPRLNFTFC